MRLQPSLNLRINYCIIMAMNTPKCYLVCKKHRIKTVVSNTDVSLNMCNINAY
jgi:hypothetical protein